MDPSLWLQEFLSIVAQKRFSDKGNCILFARITKQNGKCAGICSECRIGVFK